MTRLLYATSSAARPRRGDGFSLGAQAPGTPDRRPGQQPIPPQSWGIASGREATTYGDSATPLAESQPPPTTPPGGPTQPACEHDLQPKCVHTPRNLGRCPRLRWPKAFGHPATSCPIEGHAVSKAPEGRRRVARGVSPWSQVGEKEAAPEGRQTFASKTAVAPPGLCALSRKIPGGSRPRLRAVGPPGLMTDAVDVYLDGPKIAKRVPKRRPRDHCRDLVIRLLQRQSPSSTLCCPIDVSRVASVRAAQEVGEITNTSGRKRAKLAPPQPSQKKIGPKKSAEGANAHPSARAD